MSSQTDDKYSLLINHIKKRACRGNETILSTTKISIGNERLCCQDNYSVGHIECISIFANSSSFDKENEMLLNSAAIYGHYVCVKILLDKGVSFENINIENVKSFDIAKLFVNKGLDVNRKVSFDSSRPIQRAINYNDFESVKTLFSLGAKIDILFSHEVDFSDTEDEGEDTNIRDNSSTLKVEKITIVYYAIINNASMDILRFLIQNRGSVKNDDINLMYTNGYTEENVKEIKQLYESYNTVDIKEPDCL